MKNSGIEWIGNIPDGWKLQSLKGHLTEIKESNDPIKTTQVLSLTNKLGVIPYEEKGEQGNKSKENLSEYKLAYPNTIVANSMNILIGSVGLCNYFGCVSPVYYVFKPKNEEELKFLDYIFQSQPFQRELRRYAKGILEIRLRVSSNDILRRHVAFPSVEQQKKIVDYLEKKLAQIDELIANQEKQIEKLKEYKQSVITEAVTKGLDKSAPLKDSGIEWIGEIPESWGIVLLSSLFVEHKHKNIGMQSNNLLSLSYGKIKRKDIYGNEGLLPESFEGYNVIGLGDIVLRLTDLQNDQRSLRTGLCEEEGIVTSAYVTLRERNENLNSKYMHYYLHAFDINKGFYAMGSGVRQGLNYEGIRKLQILFPSIEEQGTIVEFLEDKCGKIDQLIAIKQEKIEKLQEYKKSLIYEYVTGKKEVV